MPVPRAPSRLPPVSLALSALVFGTAGIVFLVNPGFIGHAGVAFSGPAGAIEIRAFHGGLEIGLATFFALAALRPRWHHAGLVAQVAAFGGLALGRGLGMVLAPSADPLMLALMGAEAVGVAVGVLALRARS